MLPKHTRGEKGVSLFLGTISLVFIVPLMGLFVDVGIMYAVKARLQAAVDGASLAAARALTLGQTTAAQASTAQQNAVNWFYANFPAGNWSTFNVNMSTSTVLVYNDANNPNLRDVSVTATVSVPTWFMRFFNVTSTTMSANGLASRRDVIAMMVLDRSGSMCTPGSQPCGPASATACGAMVTHAKQFTGLFAAGRDQIGLVSFSDGAYLHSKPTTGFQATLGYSNGSGNASGAIDTIDCNGGTGTAQAVSLAYNELYKLALPGALNMILLQTDGLPNTLAYNWWDGSSAGIAAGSNCQDANGNKPGAGTPAGWSTLATMRQWTSGFNMSNGGTGYRSNVPAGAIGSLYSADPSQGTSFSLMYNPWQTGGSSSSNSILVTSSAPGCKFAGGTTTSISDFAWLPSSDIYGNSVNPSSAYKSITMSGGHVSLAGSGSTLWNNVHGAALNATDNAAYNARTNATLPVYVFVIGLGGNAGDPPDPVLLQRMANDPNGDQFNSPATYSSCASETGCVTYSSQPQGTFVYAPTSASLGQAYLRIASQALRLSH